MVELLHYPSCCYCMSLVFLCLLMSTKFIFAVLNSAIVIIIFLHIGNQIIPVSIAADISIALLCSRNFIV